MVAARTGTSWASFTSRRARSTDGVAKSRHERPAGQLHAASAPRAARVESIGHVVLQTPRFLTTLNWYLPMRGVVWTSDFTVCGTWFSSLDFKRNVDEQ